MAMHTRKQLQGIPQAPPAVRTPAQVSRESHRPPSQIGLYNGGAREARARVAAACPREPMSDDSDSECGLCVDALQDAAMF